ncbi:hypothetical protein FVE85_9689 [Porphyridium purpureum]|uniref:Reverse transcriptase Ty1/copia-type domain-containing protein n=1 Tax=Porphyridium purpureum TaxID=35688 RepID=A0A5J4YKY2_PORPP|nr:hypothetical protein FVE85_9689 [Porphyridium purpureum]|eukprot:POR4525..scf246_12
MASPNQLKARLVLRGHRDQEKNTIRGDAPAPSSTAQRIVGSIAAATRSSFFNVDVGGAYLKSGPSQRSIFVRVPAFIEARKRVPWRLVKFPDGLTDAGRQRCAAGDTQLKDMCLLQSLYYPQIFSNKGKILMFAKYVDDLFDAGESNAIF